MASSTCFFPVCLYNISDCDVKLSTTHPSASGPQQRYPTTVSTIQILLAKGFLHFALILLDIQQYIVPTGFLCKYSGRVGGDVIRTCTVRECQHDLHSLISGCPVPGDLFHCEMSSKLPFPEIGFAVSGSYPVLQTQKLLPFCVPREGCYVIKVLNPTAM